MRWFEETRIAWIGEMLDIYGFINREHIERKFGVSTPQASSDLAKAQKRDPDFVIYDKSAKRYVAGRKVTWGRRPRP